LSCFPFLRFFHRWVIVALGRGHELRSVFYDIDYRYKGRQKLGELRGDVGVLRYVFTPSFRKPNHHPKQNKKTVQPGDGFRDTVLKQGFEIT
jgi:hypothetical protein